MAPPHDMFKNIHLLRKFPATGLLHVEQMIPCASRHGSFPRGRPIRLGAFCLAWMLGQVAWHSSHAAELPWVKMPLLTPEAAAAGVSPGGEGGQWPRGPVTISGRDPDFLLLPIDVGGVYRSLDGGRHWNLAMAGWNARGGNGFAIDPENPDHVLGIGGNGMDWDAAWSRNSPNGIYRSTDRAATWTQEMSFCSGTGGALAFDPTSIDPARLGCATAYFASGGLGLFRSDDGGSHWQAVNRLPIGMANGPNETTLLAVHPRKGRVYLAGKSGLWASDDHGVIFHNLWGGGAVYGLAQPPSFPDMIFLSGSRGLLRSDDAGQHWTAMAAKGIVRQADEPIRNVTASPADPKRLLCWVLGANWAWARYVSHDGGDTFESIRIERGTTAHDGGSNSVPGGLAALPYNVRNGYFAWHPTDPNLAYGLGGDWVTRSTDGGRNFVWWNNGYNGLMLGASFNFSAHEPDMVFLGFQDYNGAFTTDGGHIWHYRDISGHGWGGHGYGAHAVDSQVMWYGDADGWGAARRTRISHDGGTTWAFAKDSADRVCEWKGADISFSDPKNGDLLFASQWRSADKGATWSPMEHCDGVFGMAPDGRLIGRKGKSLVTSMDGGERWISLIEVPGGFTDVACDDRRGRYYFASENRLKQWENGVFATVETPRDQYGNISVTTVAVDPKVPEILYVGGAKNIYASHATVGRSADAGATWENLTTGDGPQEVAWIRVHPVTREAWLNGQCYGNWRIGPPAQSGAAPPGSRNARPAPALELAASLPPPATGIAHIIRDFSRAGFDYPFGDWQAGQLKTGKGGDIGYAEIDANEHGGAGVVLGDVNLAVAGASSLALRARLLPGNAANQLAVKLAGPDQSVTFDLTKLNLNEFVTLSVPLPPSAKYDHVSQLQVQGINWSASAAALKLQISVIGLARPATP